MLKKLLFIIILLLGFINIGYSYINVSNCTTIVASGEYRLNKSIIDSTTNKCIDIQANNVLLDCQGNSIDAARLSFPDYGIYAWRSSLQTANITIKNCIVNEWDTDNIYFYNTRDIEIDNVNSSNSLDYGIYAWYANNLVINNSFFNNNMGLSMYIVSNGYIINNITANNNPSGALFSASSVYLSTPMNIIKNSRFENNGISGSNINPAMSTTCNKVTIYNNYFNNSKNFAPTLCNNAISEVNMNISYNNSQKNILGEYGLGGNFWSAPDNYGFSNLCEDSNNDSVCDVEYNFGQNEFVSIKDYLPLTYNGSIEGDLNISDCKTLRYPGDYIMNNSIINSITSKCINIQGNDINLNCQGETIDGDNIADYGVNIEDKSNFTLKNCIVNGWDRSNIYLRNSNKNTFININTTNSPDSGVTISYSNNNTFINFKSEDNLQEFLVDTTLSSDCVNNFINSTGDNGKSIIYLYNNQFNLSNWNNNFSSITLCNASNSILTNMKYSNSKYINNIKNTASLNKGQIFTGVLSENLIYDNITINNSFYGIYLYYTGSNKAKLSNIYLNQNYAGISGRSQFVNITNVTSYGNYLGGIYLVSGKDYNIKNFYSNMII